MEKKLNKLQLENLQLRGLADTDDAGTAWPILHRVICHNDVSGRPVTYLDRPILLNDKGMRHPHWHGQRRIPDEDVWERSHSSAAFVVYHEWVCKRPASSRLPRITPLADDKVPANEEVRVLSRTLREFVHDLFKVCRGLRFFGDDKIFEGNVLQAPYVFFFHFRDEIVDNFRKVSADRVTETNDLVEYFGVSIKAESKKAKATFAEGKVSMDLLPFFFKPGGLVCTRDDGVWMVHTQDSLLFDSQYSSDNTWAAGPAFNTTRVVFDGKFSVVSDDNFMRIVDIPPTAKLVEINTLLVWPIEHVQGKVVKKLIARGKIFYDCRGYRYVTCSSSPRSMPPEDSMASPFL